MGQLQAETVRARGAHTGVKFTQGEHGRFSRRESTSLKAARDFAVVLAGDYAIEHLALARREPSELLRYFRVLLSVNVSGPECVSHGFEHVFHQMRCVG